MIGSIHTILGEILPEKLGFCQCHEHLMLGKGKSFEINQNLCIDDIEKSVSEVCRFAGSGGQSIVEAQPVGCNRMATSLVEISARSNVNIIASTGFHKLQFYPDGHWIFSMTYEQLIDVFYAELTSGMFTEADTIFTKARCSNKAGIIKAALDIQNLEGIYKGLFKAAAHVQMKTGAPMMVHIEKGSNPIELLYFLMDLGVKPERLIFCHIDRACRDIEIPKKLLKSGIYLENDTIGRFKYHSDEHEIDIFKELLNNGYEDQLLFSLDTTRSRMKAYDPRAVGLDYILTTFLDKMRKNDISEEQINKIAYKNPARILAWEDKL